MFTRGSITWEKLPFIVDVPIKDGGSFHINHHFPMVFPWFSHGFPVFRWFSHGFPMEIPLFLIPQTDLPTEQNCVATARDGPSASAWRSPAGCCQPPPMEGAWAGEQKWWKPNHQPTHMRNGLTMVFTIKLFKGFPVKILPSSNSMNKGMDHWWINGG